MTPITRRLFGTLVTPRGLSTNRADTVANRAAISRPVSRAPSPHRLSPAASTLRRDHGAPFRAVADGEPCYDDPRRASACSPRPFSPTVDTAATAAAGTVRSSSTELPSLRHGSQPHRSICASRTRSRSNSKKYDPDDTLGWHKEPPLPSSTTSSSSSTSCSSAFRREQAQPAAGPAGARRRRQGRHRSLDLLRPQPGRSQRHQLQGAGRSRSGAGLPVAGAHARARPTARSACSTAATTRTCSWSA